MAQTGRYQRQLVIDDLSELRGRTPFAHIAARIAQQGFRLRDTLSHKCSPEDYDGSAVLRATRKKGHRQRQPCGLSIGIVPTQLYRVADSTKKGPRNQSSTLLIVLSDAARSERCRRDD